MQKIVINNCYGGFGLSPKGREAYLAKKGKPAFHYTHLRAGKRGIDFEHYERLRPGNSEFMVTTVTKDLGDNPKQDQVYGEDVYFDYRNIPRDDSDLVAVVNELGPDAEDDHSELKVVEIPDGVEWVIGEYDGREAVEEKHRSWSFMATETVEAGTPVHHMGRFARIWATITGTIKRKAKAVFRRKPKAPPRPRGRTGFIVFDAQASWLFGPSSEIKFTCEIEEVVRINGNSRVKVLRISGLSRGDSLYRQAWDRIDGTLQPTDQIKWRS